VDFFSEIAKSLNLEGDGGFGWRVRGEKSWLCMLCVVYGVQR